MTAPGSPYELQALAEAMAGLEVELDAAEQQAALAGYGMLAGGHAFTARSLAARIGWPRSRAEVFLGRFPRLERDDLDRVVGFRGVSLRQTAHAAAVGHQVLYGWSAWDCLVVPLVVDAATQVRSTCPVTDRVITAVLTPGGVQRHEPETVLVSFRTPGAISPEEERGGSRAASHFLAGPEAGREWAERVAHAVLLELGDAFELARRVVRRSFADALSDGSAGA